MSTVCSHVFADFRYVIGCRYFTKFSKRLVSNCTGISTNTGDRLKMEKLSKDVTLEKRKKHIGEACQLFFKQDPLKITRASKQYMYDEKGHAYLDCINNVCHVGHCHPDVIEAGYEQMKTLNTNSRFLHDNLVMLAEKITLTMPEGLDVVYFTNSGSEATDLAVRLAKHHTHGTEQITLDHAYHGHVISALEISPYKLLTCVDGLHSHPDNIHIVPSPDTYRGKYRDSEYPAENLPSLYANEIKAAIDKMKENNKQISLFIAESMQSCAGQIILPEGYLQKVYKYVHDAGGVCVADEVQVGFGRAGSHFWAFQTQGVVPDIVTIGKPMGNGHPVAAVVTTKAISSSFKNSGMEYFNTYGGNPVSCAIALAVMDVIEKEKLQDNALDVGNYWTSKIRNLKSQFPIIGDVRGLGMFIGIDLVKSRETREPASAEAKHIIARMKQEYIILSTDGPHNNIIKMKPPMCFNRENVDHFCEKLSMILQELEDNNMNINANSQETDFVEKACHNRDRENGGILREHHGFVNGEEYIATKRVKYDDNDTVKYTKSVST